MASALLFNPENDLALAADAQSFTPPKAAQSFHYAGALLPMLWAEDGDLIIAPAELEIEAERLRQEVGLHGAIADVARATMCSDAMPWGWSRDAVEQMIRAGVPTNALPAPVQIERIRELSHRRISAEFHKCLSTPVNIRPIEVFTAEDAKRILAEQRGSVVKLPWSGSGRGVLFSRDIQPTNLMQQIEGVIRRQGSVIIEPELKRKSDFAALFYIDGKETRFAGLSAFTTDNRGVYAGNLVASQERIREAIVLDVNPLINKLIATINATIAGTYRGWVGIDMMSYEDNDGVIRINPCVEVNLRCTMGVVALYLAERVLPAGTEGFFFISPKKNVDVRDIFLRLSPADSELIIGLSIRQKH